MYPRVWRHIKRSNNPNKELSISACYILKRVLPSIKKNGNAVLTHAPLSEMTRAKRDQNVNILKQLGFVLKIEFFRSLKYRNKQYYNCYKFSLTEDAIEILKNPKKHFANYSTL